MKTSLIKLASFLLIISAVKAEEGTPVLTWKDIKLMLDEPLLVNKLFIKKFKPKQGVIEHVKAPTHREIPLWEHYITNWEHDIEGLSISTIKTERSIDKTMIGKKWLSHLSIDVKKFSNYLRSTQQDIPPLFKSTPKDIQKKYSNARYGEIDSSGSGKVIQSLFEHPSYHLWAYWVMKFEKGTLTSVAFGRTPPAKALKAKE